MKDSNDSNVTKTIKDFRLKIKTNTKSKMPAKMNTVAHTVLLGRHGVCALQQLSGLAQIQNQKSEEYRGQFGLLKELLVHPPRTVYIQSEKKGSENHSGSLTFMPSPF